MSAERAIGPKGMDRVDLELGLEVLEIHPGHSRWTDAVRLKEDRAFATVSNDSGLGVVEVRQLYTAHAMVDGLPFHDNKLRVEVKSGRILLFLRDDVPLAYAVGSIADLAKTGALLGSFSDVCFAEGLSDVDCELIFQALLSWAAAHGAERVQITTDGTKAELLEAIGGSLIRATWQFPPPDQAGAR
jgi:hypothetical protein